IDAARLAQRGGTDELQVGGPRHALRGRAGTAEQRRGVGEAGRGSERERDEHRRGGGAAADRGGTAATYPRRRGGLPRRGLAELDAEAGASIEDVGRLGVLERRQRHREGGAPDPVVVALAGLEHAG